MCGIFSVIAKTSEYNPEMIREVLTDLAKLSEIRGVDSSGICYIDEEKKTYNVLRGPIKISKLLSATRIIDEVIPLANQVFFSFGHTRLVTNGSQLDETNNQPVVKSGIVGVHNGIIVNDNEIWQKYPHFNRAYEIDTEVILELLKYYQDNGKSIIEMLNELGKETYGTISIACLFDESSDFLVYSNYGSFYCLTDNISIFVLASEKSILTKLIKKHSFLADKSRFHIRQVSPFTGYLVNYENFKVTNFNIVDYGAVKLTYREQKYELLVKNIHGERDQMPALVDVGSLKLNPLYQSEREFLQYNIDSISNLKRCLRCILPETFPFIEFDEQGVCNYCNEYIPKNQVRPIEELVEFVGPYRSSDGQPDCLVPFSGGRDSTYTLHVVKNVLKMNPIAFTYDWGMVTDLGRRNIARVTGKLAVENIIVSANIKMKRDNIRANILAWLNKPNLGMVPLFMAGDKYFFYHANRVMRQNSLKISFWGGNPLENTDFKTGFCGVKPAIHKESIDYVDLKGKGQLLFYFMKNYLLNPSYFNHSVPDTLGAFLSRYILKRNGYFQIFDFLKWDEAEIETLIDSYYRWEKAEDTITSWRIGDGTAGFYNYIYFTVAGFSEYDTFRSNQVREGMITRDQALRLAMQENLPRYESIKWYLEILGLEFMEVIGRINKIKKMY